MSTIKKQWYGVALLLITTLSLYGIVQYTRTQFSPSVDTFTSDIFWTERIHAVGATAAYGEMVHAMTKSVSPMQHSAAHAFGRALYKTEGFAGFPVCGSEFTYGCAHELVGGAIADLGLDSIYSLDKTCVARLGDTRRVACQHGIGHGLLATLGYDFTDMLHGARFVRDVARDRSSHRLLWGSVYGIQFTHHVGG